MTDSFQQLQLNVLNKFSLGQHFAKIKSDNKMSFLSVMCVIVNAIEINELNVYELNVSGNCLDYGIKAEI